jgi:citrate synthase
LCDIFKSYSAGLNGLAGPLHGLANQECLGWLLDLRQNVGDYPNDQAIADYVKKTLSSGNVIPGYGHAVLRIPDPRFIAQLKFAGQMLPNNALCSLVAQCYKVIPQVLKEQGKAKNPFPNVDAHSGALMHSFGLVENDFYTVLFGVSRAIGCSVNLVWDRALMFPLERPDGLTISTMFEVCKKK